MNFEFSDDVQEMREHARRFLRERLPTGAVRQGIEQGEPFDRALWAAMAELGWLGVTIPEEFGGSGLGYEAACMLAEEIGATTAPVPFSSSIYLAAEALLCFGTQAQKQRLLPDLATGAAIGCFALAETAGEPRPGLVAATVKDGRLHGVKRPVADGGVADFAVVAARGEGGAVGLHLVDLDAPGVTRTELKMIDLSRPHVEIAFDGALAEPLDAEGLDWSAVERLLDRAAVLFAFEQVGGSAAALEMARQYALDRYAFGRPIASFQAIKHKLADIYVATELARSNAYFGAWALDHDAPELSVAAASARVAAIDAYHLASKENIQIHGGMGFTWESDCQLFYRRAKLLALNIGGARHWKQRLIAELERRNDPEGGGDGLRG